MKQRLGIANALLHDPELLLLDEPTDGVDPIGRREIRDLLVNLRDRGKTIFLNSHLLGEVELVCDRVAILEKGRLLCEGSVQDLIRVENTYEIRFAGEVGRIAGPLEAICTRVEYDAAGNGVVIGLAREEDIDRVVDLMRAGGISIRVIMPRRRSLEDVFIALVQEASGGGARV
jgi:ABC-2 type transport system ATP-binding protein